MGMVMETPEQRAQRQRRRADFTQEYLVLVEEQDALKRRLNLLRASWSTTLRPRRDNRMDDAPTCSDQLDIVQEVTRLTSRLQAISQRLQDIVCEVWLLRTRKDTAPPAIRNVTPRELAEAPDPQAHPSRHPRQRGRPPSRREAYSATV